MTNQVGAKLCVHGRQFCAECHMKEPVPIFDSKLLLRVAELEKAIERFRDTKTTKDQLAMFELVN